MNTETKEQIKTDLQQYVSKVGGQMAASRILTGVSNGTISNIVNGKWDNIADAMWISIEKQLNGNGEGWLIDFNTRRMRMLAKIYSDTKRYSDFLFVVAKEGSGKTEPALHFSDKQNVFRIKGKDHLNRKTFLTEMLTAMGKDSGGYTVYELMKTVVEELLRLDTPIFIIDEADKLNDQILYFFITIYNETEGKCAIVLQATDHLKKRILKGVAMNKKGFKELYSRGGRRFVELPDNTNDELKGIVRLNGIADEMEVNRIVNESDGDIRRVKRLTQVAKRRKEAA